MIQKPEIREISNKKLVGMQLRNTLANDKTFQLWSGFMPRLKEISNIRSPELYSIQVYDDGFAEREFTADTEFTKWAAVEVTEQTDIPDGMEPFTLSGGKYAVFIHKGPVSTFYQTLQFIFGEWLPGSGYELDDREHFEVMGEKYKGTENPESEEEVWVPVR